MMFVIKFELYFDEYLMLTADAFAEILYQQYMYVDHKFNLIKILIFVFV